MLFLMVWKLEISVGQVCSENSVLKFYAMFLDWDLLACMQDSKLFALSKCGENGNV